jgi:lipid II:glycine glycyltransferase (peptidoglycan interpeptide bridge formation enzyme)
VYGKEFPLSDNILSSIGDPFTITKKATFLLDLSKGKDKLWNLMDKNSVRKNIKRSEERGIQIREMKKSDLATYLELLEETGKTQRFNEESKSSEWWDILKQVGYRGLLAYENDVPIAAMAAAYFAGYVNEFGIVRTQRDRDAKLYSQDLLKWKIIEWSIEQKFRYYDFSGVSPESNDPKEQGIYRYKKKWGGALTQFNLLTL